jgi:YbgC/YbaW family acyl-CoA thioester hydrolase
MAYEYKMVRRVEFAETDMAGIVHFANFFRMMESTEHAFFRSLGFSVHGQEAEGATGWPRVKTECEYVRPLRFEDEVEIQLLVAEMRTRSVRYQFHFRKVSDGLEVARGMIVAVCAKVDRATGKLMPVAIPDGIRARLEVAPLELLEGAAEKTLREGIARPSAGAVPSENQT